jgi:histidinol-phosphate phosphatase family protein
VICYDIVIPTTGRDSLAGLLNALQREDVNLGRVIVVDDRTRPAPPLRLQSPVHAIKGPARGPAAARNAGFRAAQGEWVVFLDDDVVPTAGWCAALEQDLRTAGPQVAAVQGRVEVPLPADRRPTDWERNVAGLAHAQWATADMAYRRTALEAVGGFDERFRRAYREDSDLGLRLKDAGYEIARGSRCVQHPVGPADCWVSLRLQAGNADDALMAALHVRGWRRHVGAPRGRLARHLVVSAAGLGATGALGLGHRRAAGALLVGWFAGTAELAWARIAPGPRTLREIGLMTWTSALLPLVASAQWARGKLRARRLGRARWSGWGETEAASESEWTARPSEHRPLEAVLLDRDGTLIEDVPYCGDPDLVRPLPGVVAGLERLRARGLKLAVISNQSGIARGLVSERQVTAVNSRVERLLGPLGPWFVCPHGPEDSCRCRKPRPGLIEQASARLGVPPSRCAVIGDIGADVEAALAAGARPILVPTDATRPEEILAAPEVATSFHDAVESLLGSAAAASPAATRQAHRQSISAYPEEAVA